MVLMSVVCTACTKQAHTGQFVSDVRGPGNHGCVVEYTEPEPDVSTG